MDTFNERMAFTMISFLSFLVLFVAVNMNICAFIALKRSRTLAPNIRVFSMNLLVSNLLFCVAGVILAALGTEFTTDNMGPDCFPRLVAAAMMIGSYFVTSFIITAMAFDRLAAIVFPFKYLEFLRGKQIRTVCVCVWSLGLFVVVSHNIINSHLMSSCISAKYLSSNVTIGIFNFKFHCKRNYQFAEFDT